MNCWDQISAMKKQFDADLSSVLAAAKSYGFKAVKAHTHGAWTAESDARQSHSVELRATSADDLVKQMRAAVQAVEDAKKTASSTR